LLIADCGFWWPANSENPIRDGVHAVGGIMSEFVTDDFGQRRSKFTLQSVQEGVFMNATESLHSGQCGLCVHFGESHPKDNKLVTIIQSKQAPLTLLDECGHPKHAALHLKVSPISGCDGFVQAAQA
jgi:hypothetical protein